MIVDELLEKVKLISTKELAKDFVRNYSVLNCAKYFSSDYQFKKVEFKGICLKQDSASFLHKNVINL